MGVGEGNGGARGSLSSVGKLICVQNKLGSRVVESFVFCFVFFLLRSVLSHRWLCGHLTNCARSNTRTSKDVAMGIEESKTTSACWRKVCPIACAKVMHQSGDNAKELKTEVTCWFVGG